MTKSPMLFRRSSHRPIISFLVWICLFGSGLQSQQVFAQPPGMGQMPGGPGAPGQGRDKKEGPAEEAPKDKQALQPIEPVPAQPAAFRRLQFFELHGYMRFRGDYFHRLNLGLAPVANFGGADIPTTSNDPELNNKFFPPPSQVAETTGDNSDPYQLNNANCFAGLQESGITADRIARRCNRRNGVASANMRLRLEPTIHVSDTVKVHATIDVLDNLVLGSTPDAYLGDNPWAPLNLYTRTQVPPSAGLNSFSDSITVKRAYGHIRFGWGLDIKFGRMPHHWGMGIVANDGNGYDRGEISDIIRMVDTDFGDSVDSLRLGFDFGKDRRRTHTLEFAWDWAATGPTTAQLLGPEWNSGNLVGQDFSAEKFDNVYQWRLSIVRRDDPNMLKRKLALGLPVVNYGFITWVRYQSVDRVLGNLGLDDGLGANPTWTEFNNNLGVDDENGLQTYTNLLVHRKALFVTPDIWLRVNWKTLRVELEAAGVFGRFNQRDLEQNLGDTPLENINLTKAENQRTFVQFGYALEFKYGLFKDRFHIGFDHGFASGDDVGPIDQNPQSPLIAGGSNAFTNFRFNPAYMQDLLLFRELLGTVSNSAYFKPWTAFYFFQNNFSARLDLEYALAHQKQSTWGNNPHWGIGIDAALRYHDNVEPIFFQIQYGVLFPFGALNRPPEQYSGSGENALPIANNGDAKAAQTVQAQLGIRF